MSDTASRKLRGLTPPSGCGVWIKCWICSWVVVQTLSAVTQQHYILETRYFQIPSSGLFRSSALYGKRPRTCRAKNFFNDYVTGFLVVSLLHLFIGRVVLMNSTFLLCYGLVWLFARSYCRRWEGVIRMQLLICRLMLGDCSSDVQSRLQLSRAVLMLNERFLMVVIWLNLTAVNETHTSSRCWLLLSAVFIVRPECATDSTRRCVTTNSVTAVVALCLTLKRTINVYWIHLHVVTFRWRVNFSRPYCRLRFKSSLFSVSYEPS